MIDTTFQTFTEHLRKRLREPLPGEAAHARMASTARYRLGIKPNERTRRSAVLICFYPYQNSILLPLILRPQYDGVHAGQMAFPGGRMERIDENLTRTALREAQEEIGIRVSDVKVLGQLTELISGIDTVFDMLTAVEKIGYVTDLPLSEMHTMD